MWSPVQSTTVPSSCNRGSPIARCKHAMCVTLDGHIYLYGGRSANLPLKDLWRFDAGQNQWEEVKCKGQYPPNLQEHTMIAWNNKLYVFGGEIGFSSNGETPLWILDLATTSWKKQTSNPLPSVSSGMCPTGRRGHSAVLYGDAMHVYGGYQDLRGSSSELWTFDFITEQWHLLSNSNSSSDHHTHPAPRHTHSAVMHNNCMYIYGGMTDLNVRSDLWKWDFGTRLWHKIKTNKSPGELYGHSAISAYNSMFIFGGERAGILLRDLWRFHFVNESWERINAEGVIPNSRCRHVAIANPFLDSTEADEYNNKILRLSSKSNCISSSQSQNQSKALIVAPSKSISMCFGQPTDTPLHENGKALKQFKFRVHPMSALCSGRSATLSDDDEDIENGVNAVINENYGNDNVVDHFNHRNSQVTNRKSLKEKISHSRLVRSISSNSYNILHQNGLSTEELKDELERLVEESTPQMQRPHVIGANKADGNYQRLKSRSKMQKSISSNAVLESDSESSTPQHHCSNRPLSEVIQTQSVVATPLEDELNSQSWMKRRTVHESMSYYSLCFPSPPSHSKSGSESSTTSIDNNNVSGHHIPHRFSAANFEGALLSEFEEDLENGNISETLANSLSPDSGKENVMTTTIIELDDQNANITIASPIDSRPKSSGYNSSLTLYTPSIESRGIPHSVSHSSGYHSFTDESLYEHRDFAGVLQQTTAIPRRSRQIKDIHSLMELKSLNSKTTDQSQSQIAENGNPLPTLRICKENRARSWDRASTRRDTNLNTRGNSTPSCDNNRLSWQPNINVIKEVVVPGSPASRKWSYSPAKSKLHQHHWQLCMYIFGGKEQGISGVYKQPMTIWKFYI